jgi:hypothetical protein
LVLSFFAGLEDRTTQLVDAQPERSSVAEKNAASALNCIIIPYLSIFT